MKRRVNDPLRKCFLFEICSKSVFYSNVLKILTPPPVNVHSRRKFNYQKKHNLEFSKGGSQETGKFAG